MSAVAVFILFVICLVIAIPVSISLGIVAVLPGAFDPSFTASASYVIRSMLGGIDSFPLLAVPMFVLAGILMAHGKISQKLFDVFVYFIGKRTAGIPCAVIITCLFYGAISGSAPATVAAVGSMTIPLLIELGYEKDFSTAIVAVAPIVLLTMLLLCASGFLRYLTGYVSIPQSPAWSFRRKNSGKPASGTSPEVLPQLPELPRFPPDLTSAARAFFHPHTPTIFFIISTFK